MRTVSVLAFIIVCSRFIQPGFAQQQIFKNYTVNDGLISNSVRRIYQDSKGFLWIATWEGLSKYDGHRFTNFGTANGLSHSLVNDLYETSDGSLLISLNNKTIDIIKDNKVFNRAVYTGATINQITTSSHHVPILTTDGEGLQELSGGKIIRPRQANPTRTYYDLVWVSDSVFIATGDSSIGVFNSSFALLGEIKDPDFFYYPGQVYKDRNRRIWIGTKKGVRIMQPLAGINKMPATLSYVPTSFNIAPLNNKTINDIFQDNEGNMWFGTNAGLVKLGVDGREQLITVKDGIASNIITCIYQDREKNIWFGTAVGLSKLVTRAGITLYSVPNGIYTSDNLFLLQPYRKDHLIVSTRDGAKLFNKRTGSFVSVANGSKEMYYNMVQNSRPQLIMSDTKIVQFDTLTNAVKSRELISVEGASRIISDERGNRFCSNLRYLYFRSTTNSQQILNYRISGLLIDKGGNLWAATWQHGLFKIKYSIENNQLKILAKEHYLPAENIRCLIEDSKGNIWVGTRYKGVYRIVIADDGRVRIANFDQGKGLTSNFIKGIKEDSKGNFWIAFYQGLDKLIPGKNGFDIFNFSRVNNYFTSMIGILTDEDNSLWLATGEGLVHIYDGELEKMAALPVYITRVQAGDSSLTVNQQPAALNYREKQLEFEFASPGFINEKQVLYSYRLVEGATLDWSAPSNQHTVSFANLQAGSYRFEVRALGWNGQWGKPATFEFRIEPAFWNTWWFRSLAVISLALLSFLLLRKRIRSVRHEAEMKQKIAETEMMALRAQMNPHFIFNCLTSIDNLIQLDEKEKATLYLSKFAKLIRSVLENSAHNTVPCWKDMETMQLYLELESLRFDHKFTYQVNIAPEIFNGDYKVPPLVIQPFLENAIHHGLLNKTDGDKKLKVEVFVTPDHIHYLIEDNGVGRLQAASYKKQNKLAYGSMGMQITEERINIFNQRSNGSVKIDDLCDENNRSRGTMVSVSLILQP